MLRGNASAAANRSKAKIWRVVLKFHLLEKWVDEFLHKTDRVHLAANERLCFREKFTTLLDLDRVSVFARQSSSPGVD
jgi:hypothetical protein